MWFGDFFYDFLVIWIIIDPITVLPVFIALTASYDAPTRRRIAGVTVLVSLIVLALFICVGQIVIVGMGISLHAFEVAGGLILFLFAVDLVIGRDKPIAGRRRRQHGANAARHFSPGHSHVSRSWRDADRRAAHRQFSRQPS